MTDRYATHHVPCESIREELPAWVLRALNTLERAVVDRHLAECPVCRAEADRWVSIAAALPLTLDGTNPPSALRDRIMARVVAEPRGERRDSSTRPTSTRPRAFIWSQIVAAPLLIALIVVSAWAFQLQDRVATLEGESQETTIASTIDGSMLPQGVQTFGLQGECQECASSGRIMADPAKAEALVMAWGLDPSMVHQVWCVDDDGHSTMVASLDVGPAGDVVQPLTFQEPIAGYAEIYVMSRNETGEQKMEMMETPMSTPPDPDSPAG